jgi:nuclear transport factor 2 (NTF2) superfamily protein
LKEGITMRDPARIERILNLIKQIWTMQPDSRFMQLISNISWNYSSDNNDAFKTYNYSKWVINEKIIFSKDVAHVDLFNLEDDKLEAYLEEYLGKIREEVK